MGALRDRMETDMEAARLSTGDPIAVLALRAPAGEAYGLAPIRRTPKLSLLRCR